MTNIEIGALIVIIAILCQAIKKARLIQNRYIPLVSVVIGLIGAVYFSGGVSVLATASGVLLGLSTSGGYDFVKKTILNK